MGGARQILPGTGRGTAEGGGGGHRPDAASEKRAPLHVAHFLVGEMRWQWALCRDATPLRTLQAIGRLTDEAEGSGSVIEVLYVLIGASLAILLDWAIYTHLSAYLRIGFPATPDFSYCEIAFGSATTLIRTCAISATGMAAGLAFASKHASLWLVAVGLFVLAHTMLYALLYKRRERP